MSFGKNLQFLRKMHRGMTQEELAEKMNVSRQTVSKWEMDLAFPEMEKAVALGRLFSCSLDDLIVNDIDLDSKAYTALRVETVPGFRYIPYPVVSPEPEDDAIGHVRRLAASMGVPEPEIIGWDFPVVSQEQINVYHLHGYAAAWILPEGCAAQPAEQQQPGKYAIITIRDPFSDPFRLIPNGYKTLMRYMESNGLAHRETAGRLPCFERSYERDGVGYMDVAIFVAE